MAFTDHDSDLAREVREFVTRGFVPHYGQLSERFPANATWRRMRELGSQLWLDTGDIEEVDALWTGEMTALTTNNTLLNREVQKGIYDELIVEASGLVDSHPRLTERQRKLELAFILNARHGLRLVEKFDARVSVEEHTDLADSLDEAVNYGRRFHAVCPQRFIVKVPMTPAGVLAARRLGAEGIPVNQTLGFSARQNYVSASIAAPAFVNVFLGRLNSFVADNGLGDGRNVGERATLASQAAVALLRGQAGLKTRQIAASIRGGEQIRDLAGVDVYTMPPKAAREFLDLHLRARDLTDMTSAKLDVRLRDGVDGRAIRLDTLWDVDQGLKACVEKLRGERLDEFQPGQLAKFFADNGCGDVFVDWSDSQVRTSAEEGKIPRLENWRELLAKGRIGLDSLMNLAGLNSFRGDQEKMDHRVREVAAAVGR